jgi:hypothetical protein
VRASEERKRFEEFDSVGRRFIVVELEEDGWVYGGGIGSVGAGPSSGHEFWN